MLRKNFSLFILILLIGCSSQPKYRRTTDAVAAQAQVTQSSADAESSALPADNSSEEIHSVSLRSTEREKSGEGADSHSLNLGETTAEKPVVAAIFCQPVDQTSAEFSLWVVVKIHPGFYLHAADSEHPGLIPLEVELQLPKGVQQIGDWILPTPVSEAGHLNYRDRIVLQARLNCPSPAIEPGALTAQVRFQACSETSCMAPSQLNLSCVLPTTASVR